MIQKMKDVALLKLDVVLFSKSRHRPNPQLPNDQLYEIHQHLCIKKMLWINVFMFNYS